MELLIMMITQRFVENLTFINKVLHIWYCFGIIDQ